MDASFDECVVYMIYGWRKLRMDAHIDLWTIRHPHKYAKSYLLERASGVTQEHVRDRDEWTNGQRLMVNRSMTMMFIWIARMTR